MIRNLLLLVALLYASTFNTFGQTDGKFTFGLKTGINGSVFTKDVDGLGAGNRFSSADYKRYLRISGLIGLTFDYNKTERCTVGTELLYNARGMAYRKENNSVVIITNNGSEQAYTYYKYNIDYLELPIKASYNLSPQGNFNIYAGLSPSITVSAMNVTSYPKVNAGPGSSTPDVEKELHNVRTFNSSFITGFSTGRKNQSGIELYVDARLSYTLLPVFSTNENFDGENLRTRMVTGTIGLGAKF